MKKYFLIILFFVFSFAFPAFSFAQGMPAPYFAEGNSMGMGNNMMGGSNTITQSNDGHTAREEAEGKEIWEKLSRSQDRGSSTESGQAQEITCEDLSDGDFGALGEYFMGQMMGTSHEAMNNMMTAMMGEDGEEEMHVVMGKRMSNCEPNAPMPQSMPALSGVEGMGSGMMPMMMNMLAPYGTEGSRSGMMGNFGADGMSRGLGFFGWIFIILWWVLIIATIVALVKWLINQFRGGTSGGSTGLTAGKSALDILKERYAKGEIDKKEFEEKKKDL